MVEPAEQPGDLQEETTQEVNRRVWDMALNLVHPALFYVLFQLVILDHLLESPALAFRSVMDPAALGLYGAQFLGAWTVFYATLMRDMGLGSSWGTILLLAAVAAVAAQYAVFPDPATASSAAVWWFLGVQILLSCTGWAMTMVRWQRGKRAWQEEAARAQGAADRS